MKNALNTISSTYMGPCKSTFAHRAKGVHCVRLSAANLCFLLFFIAQNKEVKCITDK